MLQRGWTLAFLAAGGLAVAAGAARAGDSDVVRLIGGSGAVTTAAIGSSEDADTTLVRGWRGGCGWRGGWGGGCGWRGGWGGYRSYCGPSFYSSGYCAPAWSYCYPRYYSSYSYYSPYYCAPSVYYYSNWFSPIVGRYTSPSITLGLSQLLPGRAAPGNGAPAAIVPPSPPATGTFPYDGGPSNPVPMPQTAPVPQRAPVAAPSDDRPVSLPAGNPKKFAYPAYGDSPSGTEPSPNRSQVVKTTRR